MPISLGDQRAQIKEDQEIHNLVTLYWKAPSSFPERARLNDLFMNWAIQILAERSLRLRVQISALWRRVGEGIELIGGLQWKNAGCARSNLRTTNAGIPYLKYMHEKSLKISFSERPF